MSASRDSAALRGPSAARLILASGSAIRATVLRNAGLVFEQIAAAVDEDEVKRALRADGAEAPAVALALAELKAKRVSLQHPGALVIGADSMVVAGDT